MKMVVGHIGWIWVIRELLPSPWAKKWGRLWKWWGACRDICSYWRLSTWYRPSTAGKTYHLTIFRRISMANMRKTLHSCINTRWILRELKWCMLSHFWHFLRTFCWFQPSIGHFLPNTTTSYYGWQAYLPPFFSSQSSHSFSYFAKITKKLRRLGKMDWQ